MKFLKDNSYDIVRLLINQVGITIFSLILYTSIGAVNIEDGMKRGVNVALSVFSMLFYFALLYTVAWDWGAKDKIRIDGGRMEPDVFKGAKMAFFANVPNFILTFVCVLTFSIFLATDSLAAENVSRVFDLIIRLFMSMYLGVLQGIFNGLRGNENMFYFAQAIGYFVIPVLPILATQFGYTMGTKEKKIFGSSAPKNNNK
jgi:hypothetical protein